jgi:hypothetical protein
MLKTEGTPVTAGSPTSEGTPTPLVTLGAEGRLQQQDPSNNRKGRQQRIETSVSEQTSTTAGLQQHHNAYNSMSAKHRRDVSHIRYFINRRNTPKLAGTPGRERVPATAGSQKQQKCQQQNEKSVIAGNLATSVTAGVVETDGKFATGVVDTAGKSTIHKNICYRYHRHRRR